MKTEMEKCLAGEWYDCHNQVFLDLKTRTHKLLMKYNSLPYEEKEEKHSLLKKMLGSIGINGLVNSIGENYSQGFAFWFLICGVILILLGQTLQYYIKKEQKPAPVFLGYSILLLTVIGCIIEPVSGFWLFLPQAIIIIYPNKK